MGVCSFVEELSKLRKSSRDSVDNTETFDDFKKYMHITRQIEVDLKSILRHVNQNESNSLVLLCGSAGDGKSHLLSYLKNTDDDNLLTNYTIYNDGTESSAPNKTAIDTLNELLNEYSDDNLSKDEKPNKSIILAINLGVLNNFIESEYGKRYGLLKKYVQDREILTSRTNGEVISDNLYFQSINFSDYHMFNLSDEGANIVFIDSIMEKVFGNNDGSPFLNSYKTNCCGSCVKSASCPVKHNFEFMQSKNSQQFVSQTLVECIVKDKVILTARELQNFLYDIIVPLSFDPLSTWDTTDIKRSINSYLGSLTPSLMFEQRDTSPLVNIIKKYDPVIVRTEKTDEEAIEFYVANNAEESIAKEFSNLPYKSFIFDSQVMKKIGSDKGYRSKIFSSIKRCQAFLNGGLTNNTYKAFLLDLYHYNANAISELEELYDSIERAVKQWCGTDSDDNLCIESNKLGYELYEEVEFNAYSDGSGVERLEGELSKFTNYITVEFVDENSDEPIPLVIDYNLYDLIMKLNNGYIQTSEDRNNHADFLTFIKKLKNSGGSDEKVIVMGPNGIKVTFQKKKLGYSYKNK